jgi:hypothetical protein
VYTLHLRSRSDVRKECARGTIKQNRHTKSFSDQHFSCDDNSHVAVQQALETAKNAVSALGSPTFASYGCNPFYLCSLVVEPTSRALCGSTFASYGTKALPVTGT